MKKLSMILALSAFGISVLLTSCGGGGTEQKTQQPQAAVQKQEAQPAGANAAQMARGEEIYKTKCFACHQLNGQGLPNAFPSLVGSEFLLKTPKLAVSQVLNGSAHVVADRKVKYPAPMPPQVDNKEDAVAVINYVSHNFGNNGGYITVDDVKDVQILPR